MARVTIKELQEQIDFLEKENEQLRKRNKKKAESDDRGWWKRLSDWRSGTCLDEILIWGTVCLIGGYTLCLFQYWSKIIN